MEAHLLYLFQGVEKKLQQTFEQVLLQIWQKHVIHMLVKYTEKICQKDFGRSVCYSYLQME